MLETIRKAASQFGLNLVAAIPIERFDATVRGAATKAGAISAEARSVVVVANGGGAFWEAFQRHCEAHPGWRQRKHPLDDFTAEVIEKHLVPPVTAMGARCAVVYPFTQDGPTLNFVELGKAAGLAGPSILGVVVNPVFGPWIAFRAALLVDRHIDLPGDAIGFDPCPTCTARSCVTTCPVGAVSYPAGWDIPRCLTHRVEEESDCASRCHARVGCVLGPEHRYPEDELRYHQMRALASMRPYYETHLKPRRS